MPGSTVAIVLGSWILLAVLSVLAFRFNARQADED
jgi:hypothetical protein